MAADKQIRFQDYLKEEVDRVRGAYYPVKAGFFRQAFVRHTLTKRLHPNPEDEFCHPDIGPNYSIIGKYKEAFRRGNNILPIRASEEGDSFCEPLMVQKARPDGYLILNGHHRWAAAFITGVRVVDVKVVNLTEEKDIRKMLERARSDRRVTLDLDEVVFCDKDDAFAEKTMPFPLNRIYKERVRQGIPALFHFLNVSNLDIWVYSSKYHSMEYVYYYFRRLGVRLTGVVTGTGRKNGAKGNSEEIKKLMETKYASTIHIDAQSVMRTVTGSRECDEQALSGSPETWSREVIDAIVAWEKAEK